MYIRVYSGCVFCASCKQMQAISTAVINSRPVPHNVAWHLLCRQSVLLWSTHGQFRTMWLDICYAGNQHCCDQLTTSSAQCGLTFAMQAISTAVINSRPVPHNVAWPLLCRQSALLWSTEWCPRLPSKEYHTLVWQCYLFLALALMPYYVLNKCQQLKM